MPGTRGAVPVPLETQDRNLTQDVLDLLDTKDTLQTDEDFPTISQAEIKAALDRLASRSMVEYTSKNTDKVALTAESEDIVKNGSHEIRVWKAIKEAEKVSIKDLPVRTYQLLCRTSLILKAGQSWRPICKRRNRQWLQEQVD
jgi:phenylalanyl-tRNA synthetase alpha chain